MKLRTYLQSQGIPRRTITAQISAGQISCNEIVVTDFNQEVSPGDTIHISSLSGGQTFHISSTEPHIPQIMLFHKPIGYVCSKKDPHNPTIYELLPPEFHTRRYIGRLDKDSRGLVILTNEPSLVHQRSHPSFEITKTYEVTIDHPLSPAELDRVVTGVDTEIGLLRLDSIEELASGQYICTLHEWANRHIRRVFDAVWHTVRDLCRIREWEYSLDSIAPREYVLIDLPDSKHAS